MTPSAHSAASRAVSVLTAAANSGGGDFGEAPDRGRGRRGCARRPRPPRRARRRRITSIVSTSRASRSSFVGPRVAGDVLVDRLAAADRRPEPARDTSRRGSRSSAPVIAGWYRCPGAVTTPSEKLRGLERGREPAPGVPRVALPHAPGLEVVAAHRGVEARLLGVLHRVEQAAGRELLVRGVESDDRHAHSFRTSSTLPDPRGCGNPLRRPPPCTGASGRRMSGRRARRAGGRGIASP